MAAPIKKPCFIAGTPRSSGVPQTGEIAITRGGNSTLSVWSGNLLTNSSLTGAPGAVQSGGHVLLVSGPGRLNSVVMHQNPLTMSGVAITFYDAGTIAPSGVSVSGQRFLAIVGAPGGVSGQLFLNGPSPFQIDMPFSSGLCAGAASGTTGFSVSICQEVVEPAFGRDG